KWAAWSIYSASIVTRYFHELRIMSSSSRIRKTNHASGFDRRRPGHGMKRLYGMDSPAVHPYIPGRLGITSRYARDYDSATVVRPQKFGFFNQALPSISAGHVNEVRAYV
uniref:Uncharacterized protein n=2 Tax=Parascaris univalens TaxID=6257 RepID=A0A915CK88_PARUN